VEQLKVIIRDISSGIAMDATMKSSELSGWTESDVVYAAESLGKFWARSTKQGYTGNIVGHSDLAVPTLVSTVEDFLRTYRVTPHKVKQAVKLSQVAQDPARPVQERDQAARKLDEMTQSLPRGYKPQETRTVIIPQGWERADLGRDISQSLGTVIDVSFDEQSLQRFIDRTYTVSEPMLAADHMFGLLWLTEQNMLERLLEIGPQHAGLAKVLSKAWTLMDTAVADAISALEVLVAPDALDKVSPADLAAAAAQARMLAPAELDRMHDLMVDLSGDQDSHSLQAIARRRIASLSQVAQISPQTFRPAVPWDLNHGHVTQICINAGLVTDYSQERAVAYEIRLHLTQMGLAADLDYEVGEGLKAWKMGLLEEFYSNRRLRAAGDPAWSEEWSALCATAS